MSRLPRLSPRALAAPALLATLFATHSAAQGVVPFCGNPNTDPLAGRLLRSLAYGSSPGELDAIATSGPVPWVLSQLNPGAIASNPQLDAVLAGIHIPTGQGDDDTTVNDLANWMIAHGLYSEAQLEARLTAFWRNHFTTFFFDVAAKAAGNASTAAWFEYLQLADFKAGALGNYNDLITASATNPSMLYYLDNYTNTAAGPNENYAREFLELHMLGVGADYSGQDVADVATVFTGWTVARVLPLDFGNPHATPISNAAFLACFYDGDVDHDGIIDQADVDLLIANEGTPYNPRFDIWDAINGTTGPDGVNDSNDTAWAQSNLGARHWVYTFHFDTANHDYNGGAQKVLFSTSTIPTLTLPAYAPGDPNAINEGFLLMQHLSGTDETARFIITKLYNYFIADAQEADIDPVLMQDLVTKWQSSNGNIGGILRLLFARTFFTPGFDNAWDKARDGYELSLAMVRAWGGSTPLNATAIDRVDRLRDWMDQRQGYQLLRLGPPDGYPEGGDEVIDTGGILSFVQLAQDPWDKLAPLTPPLPDFNYDFHGLVVGNGADPDSSFEVLCTLLRYTLQGNYDATDWGLYKNFLLTDEFGNPVTIDYTNNPGGWNRAVAKTAGFVLAQTLLQ